MTADLALPPAAEARLRATLDAAATTAPVPPAWDAVRTRVAGERTVPPLPRRRWRPAALVAAAVVLVALAGAAVVAGRQGDVDLVAGGPSAADEAYCAVLERPSRSRIEVAVFVAVDAGDVAAIERAIAATGLAEDVAYIDRDASYAEARRLFEGETTMRDLLRPEDVPTSFRLTVADEDAATELATALEGMPGVQDVEDAWRPGTVFHVLDGMAGGDAGPADTLAARQRVDDDVVDALAATGPEELDDAIATIDPVLRSTRAPDRGEVAAAQTLAADAGGRCRLTPVVVSVLDGVDPPATATTDPP